MDTIPTVRGRRGRSRRRPGKAHLDKGCDYPRCLRALRQRGICPRITRRGVESSQRLGRYRWVVERTLVERTLAWLHAFRRVRVRYEHHPEVHHDFLCLGCKIIPCATPEAVAELCQRIAACCGLLSNIDAYRRKSPSFTVLLFWSKRYPELFYCFVLFPDVLSALRSAFVSDTEPFLRVREPCGTT